MINIELFELNHTLTPNDVLKAVEDNLYTRANKAGFSLYEHDGGLYIKYTWVEQQTISAIPNSVQPAFDNVISEDRSIVFGFSFGEKVLAYAIDPKGDLRVPYDAFCRLMVGLGDKHHAKAARVEFDIKYLIEKLSENHFIETTHISYSGLEVEPDIFVSKEITGTKDVYPILTKDCMDKPVIIDKARTAVDNVKMVIFKRGAIHIEEAAMLDTTLHLIQQGFRELDAPLLALVS